MCSRAVHGRTFDERCFTKGTSTGVGFMNRDENHILYNKALQFRGLRALEIGCWLGWSTCQVAMVGVILDVVDPFR